MSAAGSRSQLTLAGRWGLRGERGRGRGTAPGAPGAAHGESPHGRSSASPWSPNALPGQGMATLRGRGLPASVSPQACWAQPSNK